MKILITGGAGYIGSILVNKLFTARMEYFYGQTREGDYGEESHRTDVTSVTVLDNLMYRQISLTDVAYRPNFNFIHGDVRDKELLLSLVKDADLIIPLAAIVGFPACEKDKDLATQINFDHVKYIVRAMSKDQRIIYPNTNSGYGVLEGGTSHVTEDTPLNPISHYGRTKTWAESIIRESGNGIMLRLATVFGVSPRMRLDLLVNDFVYKAVTDKYIVLFEKGFRRNFIHLRDVVLTFIYMMNNYELYNGQVFNVGLSNANLSKQDLAEKIKKYIPEFVIKWDDFANDPDKRDYIVSNEKLENTGWKPYYSLDDGIKELITAYKFISHENRRHTNL